MVNKRVLVGLISVALVIVTLGIVYAATLHSVPTTPNFVAEQSQSILFNITINDTGDTAMTDAIHNVSITLPAGFTFNFSSNIIGRTWGGIYNGTTTFSNSSTTVLLWSNGTSTTGANGTLINGTAYFIFNASVGSVANTSGGQFNITIITYNMTGNTSYTMIPVGVFDTTSKPKVSIFAPAVHKYINYTTATVSNKSFLLVLNITANVSIAHQGMGGFGFNISSVYFNVTNSSGRIAWIKASNETPSSNKFAAYNATLNMSNFTNDGVYTITVWANDTLNNVNNSETFIINYDTTAPTVTLGAGTTGTQETTTQTTTALNITITDTGSGWNGTCNSSGGNSASTIGTNSGGDSVKTLNESGLTCNTEYTYYVSCYDGVSLTGTSSKTIKTSACSAGSDSGGGAGGGGASTTTWSNTFIPSVETLSTGYEKELGAKERVKVMVGKTTHHVGVTTITATSATIEVASTPQTATLNVGETKRFDVDGDNTYDLSVTLNSITGTKANFKILTVSETMTAEEIAAGEVVAETTPEVTEEVAGESVFASIWFWVIIVVLVGVGIYYYMKKK